jgi:hypothetical protein
MGRARDQQLYAVAAALVASGLIHVGVQLVRGGAWEGPVSWRKPITFGLAFGLTLATMTWVTSFVAIPAHRRRLLLRIFAVASVAEVAVITTQAWRRVPSHFNTTTAANAAMAYTAAAGGAVLIVVSVLFAAASVRGADSVAFPMRLAVRVGFATFLLALAVGALMIGIGVRTARTVSQTAAYSAAGYLKPAHAVLMHGILVLPALAWLSGRAAWEERTRTRVVAVASVGYVALAAVVLVVTLTEAR